MQAVERPRPPMRCRQRTRGSRSAMARTASAVPSRESSSTKITSQATPPRTQPTSSTKAGPAVEDYADRVADALRALRLGPGSAVLGNGFGGFVAVALAARHGALFERLLLIDTAAGFPQAAKAAFAVMADKVAAGGMGAVAEIAARRIFHDAYLSAYPEAVAERRAVLMRFDPAAFVAACRALEQVDLRAALPAIANPTLVLVGELDAATPLDLARELAERIKGARFVMLPRCRHCPPLEQPDAFLAAIGPFLGLPRQ